MINLLSNLKISVPDNLYLKDPESSELGKRIVEQSILLIDKVGFESFTFKKLGIAIGSNESSIYRYFESKHKLLLYLTSWYWAWMEYRLVFSIYNITNAKQQLINAIDVLTKPVEEDKSFLHINEVILNRIVINEYSKSYLTKQVDDENREGYFSVYKRIVQRLSSIILEVDSTYQYPNSLASTIVEGALHQHFLMAHFRSITDCNDEIPPNHFFNKLTQNVLNAPKYG